MNNIVNILNCYSTNANIEMTQNKIPAIEVELLLVEVSCEGWQQLQWESYQLLVVAAVAVVVTAAVAAVVSCWLSDQG